MKLKEQLSTLADNIKTYWRRPPEGKYMPFKEVAAYSVGGIGAYFIITLGTACLLATGNTLISSTLGVKSDGYVCSLCYCSPCQYPAYGNQGKYY